MFSLPMQVLRYSALAAGAVYGVYHQTSLNSQARRAEADREYARKAQLIEQAKAEWKKKTAPQEPQTQQPSGGMFRLFGFPARTSTPHPLPGATSSALG